MSAPTSEELELISVFKERVKDILYTEEHFQNHFLIRWIRAREGNLDKAEEMIRNSFNWRKENDVDNALTSPVDPWFAQHYPYHIRGKDRSGRPVVELPINEWDVRKTLQLRKEAEFFKYVNQFFENIIKKIRESNSHIQGDFPNTQFVIIVNWKGYTYSQLANWKALSSLIKMACTYEAHYPEILYKCFDINTPRVFPYFTAMVNHLFASKTLAKVHVYGTNRDEWGPEVEKVVEGNQIGKDFGGTIEPIKAD